MEVQEVHSIGCRAVAPKKIYNDPFPWLDTGKVDYCNCTKFPNIGIIGIKPNLGINNVTFQPSVTAATDTSEAKNEDNLHAQRSKLKGTCFHADFQIILKRIKMNL